MRTLRRIRQTTEVNLLDCIVLSGSETDLLVRITNDSVLLCEVLHAACEDQIDVELDDWLDDMEAEQVNAGYEALMQALPHFFSRPEQQEIMATVLETGAKKVTAALAAELENVQQTVRELETSGTHSPSDAQASPESVQTTATSVS